MDLVRFNCELDKGSLKKLRLDGVEADMSRFAAANAALRYFLSLPKKERIAILEADK